MLKLRLATDVGPDGWTWSGDAWTCGASRIEPFGNPALEHVLVVRTDRAAAHVTVRESRAGEPAVRAGAPVPVLADDTEYERLLARARAWDLAATTVEIGPGTVRVHAGPTGVAPVYLTVAPSTGSPADSSRTGGLDVPVVLHGSWDPVDLRPYVDVTDLNPAEVVRWVTYLGHYSAATIFRTVVKVTERATATWTPAPPPGPNGATGGTSPDVTDAGVTVTYPPPAAHAAPRRLRPGADPVGHFADLLDHITALRPLDPGRLAVELSGGLDSANVAASIARTYPAPGRAVRSVALIVEGAAGEQQQRRRKELLDRFSLHPDREYPIADAYPFRPGGPRRTGTVFSPVDGTYAEATAQIYADLAADGVSCVATGIGGDEAMSLSADERHTAGTDWPTRPLPGYLGARCAPLLALRESGTAPAPVLTFSTLLGLACRSPEMMRHGLWPISPLAAPAVQRLGESLPVAWRLHKRLLRERLARLGLSHDVLHPELSEQFGPTITAAMRRDGIPLLRRFLRAGAILTEHGYLDGGRLLAACDRAESTGQHAEALYRPLMLEAALRSMH